MQEHVDAYTDRLGECGAGTEKPQWVFGDIEYDIQKTIPAKSFAIMKKHFKAYIEGFPGAKELRMKLMEAEDGEEIRVIIDDFCKKNPELVNAVKGDGVIQ
jgi:tRNA-dihydrouridine synthase